jgi:two-component system response regulator NreC
MWSSITTNPDRRSVGTGQASCGTSLVNAPVTIVLADDHTVVRSGLRILLESDGRFSVLAEASDAAAVIEQVRTCRPQVLLLDLNMGSESSLHLIPRLRADSPDTQIVVLTMQEDPTFANAALRGGAVGYVLKDAATEELMNAVLLGARGQIYLDPQLRARMPGHPAEQDASTDTLSPRETEVLALIASGHTNTEIAASLFLSVRTVESHRAHLQQKTGLTSRAELVGYARERGLLD